MSVFVDSLLSGVGSSLGGIPGTIVGGVLGSIFGGSSQKKQYQYQSKLMQQQFDLEKQMFDYTSEYNNAANQVQRLKDANLNPNLAYGNGQVAGGTGQTGSISSGNEIGYQVDSNVGANALAAQSFAKNQSERDLLASQSEYYRSMASTEAYKALSEKAKAKYADEFMKNQVTLQNIETMIGRNQAELYKANAQTEIERQYNLRAQASLYIKQAVTEGMRPAEIASNIAKNYAEVDYKKALTAVCAYQIDLIVSQIGELNARSHLHMSKSVWQNLRNGDYEKITNHELNKIMSEVFRNQTASPYSYPFLNQYGKKYKYKTNDFK